MSTPPVAVDVIIPVHTVARPIARAVSSVLRGTRAGVRVLVVCHEVDPAAVQQALARAGLLQGTDSGRVEILVHRDGIRSPAGPFNRGWDAAESPYVAELGSDDTLAPGALDAWLSLAEAHDAAVVLPRVISPHALPTPPVRPVHRRLLDPIADRIAYRSSTVGLISRQLSERARATEGLATGEDIAPSLRLWFSGARIAWAGREPGYVVHDDGDDRATARRTVSDALAFVPSVVDDEMLRALTAADRAAIAAKLLRVNVFGAVGTHSGPWLEADRCAVATAVRTLAAFGDGESALSLADHRLLRLVADRKATGAELDRAATARTRRLHPSTLLPAHPTAWGRPDGAGRIDAAFALMLVDSCRNTRPRSDGMSTS